VELDRQLALEADVIKRREFELRLAQEHELELERAAADKARL